VAGDISDAEPGALDIEGKVVEIVAADLVGRLADPGQPEPGELRGRLRQELLLDLARDAQLLPDRLHLELLAHEPVALEGESHQPRLGVEEHQVRQALRRTAERRVDVDRAQRLAAGAQRSAHHLPELHGGDGLGHLQGVALAGHPREDRPPIPDHRLRDGAAHGRMRAEVVAAEVLRDADFELAAGVEQQQDAPLGAGRLDGVGEQLAQQQVDVGFAEQLGDGG
jgi:hypothetical protein